MNNLKTKRCLKYTMGNILYIIFIHIDGKFSANLFLIYKLDQIKITLNLQKKQDNVLNY